MEGSSSFSSPSCSFTTLYPSCMATKKQIDALLSSFESSGASSSSSAVATQQRLVALTQHLEREVSRLCSAFEKEKSSCLTSSQQEAVWRRRIAVLREDTQALQNAVYVQLGFAHRRQLEERRQRDELLGGDKKRRGAAVEAARQAELSYARERDKLKESHNMIDSILVQGRGVLDKMVQQNTVLKAAKRKVLDMTSAAGLSSSVIGAVMRRHTTDRRLVWGGMALTLIFFFLLYRYVHYGGDRGGGEAANLSTKEPAVEGLETGGGKGRFDVTGKVQRRENRPPIVNHVGQADHAEAFGRAESSIDEGGDVEENTNNQNSQDEPGGKGGWEMPPYSLLR
ncbi:golgi snare [Cystoisospora suis]|uniref:Golgi snare n=1 Tax=Cystoisospora suis TaxID=483139 RepID=A0A2C6KDV3_9APIC|nr:golgi snare [Cystoisospora suis]